MKKHVFFLIMLLSTSLAFTQNIEQVKDFGDNPGHLRMFQYIPEALNNSTPSPLVLVLHGSWQSAKTLSRCGGWNKLADSLGFMVIYPDQPLYNNFLTAFSFYFPKKMEKDHGETASIRCMIDYMSETHSIDPKQIFIIGMSAGGAMANVMLNAYPDLFAAGALIAAPSILHAELSTSTAQPRIAIIQGEKDITVGPKNADRLVAQWAQKHHLNIEAGTTMEGYLNYRELTLRSYDDRGRILVRLDIADMGHRLLIDPGESLMQGGKSSLFSKDIDFHLPYWIMDFFALLPR